MNPTRAALWSLEHDLLAVNCEGRYVYDRILGVPKKAVALLRPTPTTANRLSLARCPQRKGKAVHLKTTRLLIVDHADANDDETMTETKIARTTDDRKGDKKDDDKTKDA
jgi:hypothetical protein